MTPNFSIEEFCYSAKAVEWKVDNTPPQELLPTIIRTLMGMERIRQFLGDKPILISSGYRSKEVNKLVGGQKDSQHMRGEACDFRCPDFGSPYNVATHLAKNKELLGIDQLILEYGRWIHVSFSDKPRYEALTISKAGVQVGIQNVG